MWKTLCRLNYDRILRKLIFIKISSFTAKKHRKNPRWKKRGFSSFFRKFTGFLHGFTRGKKWICMENIFLENLSLDSDFRRMNTNCNRCGKAGGLIKN